MRVGQLHKLLLQCTQARHDDIGPRTREHQGMRGIVDVFGGAGEMDELGRARQLGMVFHLLFQPIFHRLDVVVGDALDIFDAGGVGLGKVLHQRLQAGSRFAGKGRQFRQIRVGQGHQPGHLHFHAVRHEAGFGQQAAQRIAARSIAAVQRR
jgi:hypothetical protein